MDDEQNIFGSVVALEFNARPAVSFSDIVDEIDAALEVLDSRTCALSWDCDDIAILDRDYIRVALGWLPAPAPSAASYLVIAVGEGTGVEPGSIDPSSFEFVIDTLIDCVGDLLPFQAALKSDALQPVDCELIDAIFDHLRPDAPPAPVPARLRTPDNIFTEIAMPEMLENL